MREESKSPIADETAHKIIAEVKTTFLLAVLLSSSLVHVHQGALQRMLILIQWLKVSTTTNDTAVVGGPCCGDRRLDCALSSSCSFVAPSSAALEVITTAQ
jgi:hypothetical protein